MASKSTTAVRVNLVELIRLYLHACERSVPSAGVPLAEFEVASAYRGLLRLQLNKLIDQICADRGTTLEVAAPTPWVREQIYQRRHPQPAARPMASQSGSVPAPRIAAAKYQ